MSIISARTASVVSLALLVSACGSSVETPNPPPGQAPALTQLRDYTHASYARFEAGAASENAVEHHFRAMSFPAEGVWFFQQRRYPFSDRPASRWIAYPSVSIEQAQAARLLADGIQPDDLARQGAWPSEHYRTLEACRMGWQRLPTEWQLRSDGNGCGIDGHAALHQRLRFDKQGLTWQLAANGGELEGNSTRFWPVQSYQGWLGFRDRLSVQAEQWQRLPDITVNDLRGRYRFTVPVSQREFVIELQRLHYPNSDTRLLQLKVLEDGELIASAWGPPNTEHIGLHLPWLQVGLQRRGSAPTTPNRVH